MEEEEKKKLEDFVKTATAEKQKPVYDPSKKYQWEPGTNFILAGEEFASILNSLRLTLNSPEAQRILMAERAHFAIEKSLSRAVEMGFAKAIEEPQQSKQS